MFFQLHNKTLVCIVQMMFHLLVKLSHATQSIIEVLCCWRRDSLSRGRLSKTFWMVRCVPTGGQRSKISYTLKLRFSWGFCFTLMKPEGGGTRLWSKRPRGDGGTRSQQMSEEMSRHWSSARLSRGGTKEPVQPWKQGPSMSTAIHSGHGSGKAETHIQSCYFRTCSWKNIWWLQWTSLVCDILFS